MARLTINGVDRLGKRTSMTIEVPDNVTSGAVEDLAEAVAGITLRSEWSYNVALDVITGGNGNVPPANDLASVYKKWLLRVQDNVNGKLFTHEIGVADHTMLPSPTSDFLDLTTGPGAVLKSAFEAVYRSPYGNAGTLLSVQEISRSG